MAVKRSLSAYSGIRLDIPHLRSLESSVRADFDDTLRGLVTGLDKPYILRGFKIKIPTTSSAASTLQVEVSDSAVLHSTATESGTILAVPAGQAVETLDSANTKVIGSFQSGVPNYIALDFRRQTDTSTIDQTAGWSAAQQIEYQRTTPIGRILDYRFVITTNGFGTNLPLYIVGVSSIGNVDYLTCARDSLFRLGRGGANPDSQFSFAFGNLSNNQPGANPRREWVNTTPGLPNSLSVAPAGPNVSAFDYGDFSIKSLKDWMDAVMTRFKEMSNSPYWYVSTGLSSKSPNIFDLWWDTIGSVMTGKGSMSFNMVLEGSAPTSGIWQTAISDPSILFGDSYVQGFTSGNEAIVTSNNGSQLLVNSLTKGSFVYSETLYNRRKFRPNLSKYSLSDYSENPDRLAKFERIGDISSGIFAAISSWTYTNVAGTDLEYSLVDITTTAPHGFVVGDTVLAKGLQLTGLVPPPNGILWVKEVLSPSAIRCTHPFVLAGVASVAVFPTNGIRLDTSERLPYMPKFQITQWSNAGTTCTIKAIGNTFQAPVVLSGDTSLGSPNILNLSSTSDLKLNQDVSGTGILPGSVITSILSPSSVEISQNASATNTGVSLTFKDQVIVIGLIAATNTPSGKFTVDALGSNLDEFQITAALAPTSPNTVTADAAARPDVHFCKLTITGAQPDEFDVTDAQSTVTSDVAMRFLVGPDTLPPLNVAIGLYQLDGVVAESTVLDPVRVTTITNNGSGTLTVTTTTPHNLPNSSSITFTIYGDPANSIYIRSYSSVDINVLSPTSFEIIGTGLNIGTSYTNPLNAQSTFVRFSDNPYPGPIAWSEDIYIKGIIGDRWFRIPQSAVCDTSDPDSSPVANQFNINGQTGTAYLKNGEAAYIILERNESVSSGAIYSTSGGGSVVTGPTAPLDISSANLKSGDFVKWEDEDESKWLRIAGVLGTSIIANSFSLEDDLGQTPSLAHRPAKTGKLVYSKGTYGTIFVKQHHLINSDANVYWIAVRRDNGSTISKAYLRGMELEAGEIRQINDNQNSNLLDYVGSPNESARSPNYEQIQTVGPYQLNQTLTVDTVDTATRMVTFDEGPDLNFSKGDRIVKTVGLIQTTFTVSHTLSSRTVVFVEDVSTLSALDSVQYFRVNYQIANNDNLTLALRKEDREQARVNTALTRPIYDEQAFVQQIDMLGTGTIRSGSYIYKGTQTNPTALAWVMHGNAAVVETIEDAPVTMPGGHVSVGPNSILVSIISGTFLDGDGIYQNGVLTSRTINNPANPPFTAPSIAGGPSGSGVELVLPPNRRTQVVGSEYVVFPTHSKYNKSDNPILAGEDLFVIANGNVTTSVVDYIETFEGPKAKISLVTSLPSNTKIRFRQLAAFGSSLAAKASGVTLQVAYNGGQNIIEAVGLPVVITASNVIGGETALKINGSIEVYGGTSQVGGIFGPATTDQQFVIGNESNKPKESWTGLSAIKTHTSHPGSAVTTITAAQTVTGSSPTTITGSTITLLNNYVYRVRAKATARRSDGTFGNASFTMEGTFYRDSGGPATASGYPMTRINGADGDGIDYAIAFGLSGNDVVAVVYGTTASTIQWTLSMEFQAVGLAS